MTALMDHSREDAPRDPHADAPHDPHTSALPDDQAAVSTDHIIPIPPDDDDVIDEIDQEAALAQTTMVEADDDTAAEEAEFEAPSLRAVIGQTIIVSGIILAAIVLGSAFLKEALKSFADWIVGTFGVYGILIGIMMSDTLTFPVPPDTYLFVAVATNKPMIPMLTAICTVSVLSGSIAYLIGPFLQRVPFLSRRIEAWRPRGEAMFGKWGIWAIAIAALSPLPYSMACWFAGIYKMSYRRFALATLFRIPRMIGYYMIIRLGWMPG